VIDGAVFDREFGAQFVSMTGRPALPTRRVAGLLYLETLYAFESLPTETIEAAKRTGTVRNASVPSIR
jgi:hypothetical protein